MDLDYDEEFKTNSLDDTLFTAPLSYVSW